MKSYSMYSFIHLASFIPVWLYWDSFILCIHSSCLLLMSCISQFVYPFTCQWLFYFRRSQIVLQRTLVPSLYELICFHFSWVNTWGYNGWIICGHVFKTLRICQIVCQSVAFYIPNQQYMVLVPPNFHQHMVWSDFQNFSHSNRRAEISHCGFNLHSLMISNKHIFMCHLYCVYSSVCVHFFLFICCFLIIEFWECFLYSRSSMFCRYFLTICSFVSHSLKEQILNN